MIGLGPGQSEWILYGAVVLGVLTMGVLFVLIGKELYRRVSNTPGKPTPKATVKTKAPTEEELLLAMSDTELLRELVRLQRMSLRSQQSQTRVSRLGIFGFLALFSGGE